MQIKVPFTWELIVFLVVLEVLTIPFVAISNSIIKSNKTYIIIIGFGVAFMAIAIIMKLIIPMLKLYLFKLMGKPIAQINGVFYITWLSGMLLMLMFYIQIITYQFTDSDFIVGGVSAFFGVGAILLLYTIIQKIFDYGIIIKTTDTQQIIYLNIKDILVVTTLITLYETIISPVSIIWEHFPEQRFVWGIISGLLSGMIGGSVLGIICRITNYKITIELRSLR